MSIGGGQEGDKYIAELELKIKGFTEGISQIASATQAMSQQIGLGFGQMTEVMTKTIERAQRMAKEIEKTKADVAKAPVASLRKDLKEMEFLFEAANRLAVIRPQVDITKAKNQLDEFQAQLISHITQSAAAASGMAQQQLQAMSGLLRQTTPTDPARQQILRAGLKLLEETEKQSIAATTAAEKQKNTLEAELQKRRVAFTKAAEVAIAAATNEGMTSQITSLQFFLEKVKAANLSYVALAERRLASITKEVEARAQQSAAEIKMIHEQDQAWDRDLQLMAQRAAALARMEQLEERGRARAAEVRGRASNLSGKSDMLPAEQQKILAQINAELRQQATLAAGVAKQYQQQLKDLENVLKEQQRLKAAEHDTAIQKRVDQFRELYGVVITEGQAERLIASESIGAWKVAQEEISIIIRDQKLLVQGLGRISSALGQIGMTARIMGTIAIGSFAGFIATSQSLIESLRRLTEETGLSFEGAQKLLSSFRAMGVDSSSAERGIKLLAESLQKASDHDAKAIEKFQALHVSYKDLKEAGFDLTKVLALVSDGLETMAPGTERTAAGADLMGKSFTALLPALSQGGKALLAGVGGMPVLTEKAAQSLSKMAQTIETVKLTLQTTAAEFINSAAPAVKVFTDGIEEAASWVRDLDSSTKTTIANVLVYGGAFLVVGGTIAGVLSTLTKFGELMLAQTAFTAVARTAILGFVGDIGGIVPAVGGVLLILTTLTEAITLLSYVFGGVSGPVITFAGTLLKAITYVGGAAIAIKLMSGSIVAAVQIIVSTLIPVLDAVSVKFLEASESAGVFSNVLKGVGFSAAGAAKGLSAYKLSAAELALPITLAAAAIYSLASGIQSTMDESDQWIQYVQQMNNEAKLAEHLWTMFGGALNGTAEEMAKNAELMRYSADVLKVLNDQVEEARRTAGPNSAEEQSLQRMITELTKALNLTKLDTEAIAKKKEKLKDVTEEIRTQGKQLLLNQKIGEDVTQQQIHEYKMASLSKIAVLEDEGIHTAALRIQLYTTLAALQNNANLEFKKSTLNRLHVEREAFETRVKNGEISTTAEILEFQRGQEAIIATLQKGDRAKAEAQLMATIMVMLKQHNAQELQLAKDNVEAIGLARRALIDDAQERANLQIAKARGETTVRNAQQELALDQQLASGKLSIAQAEQIRRQMATARHQAEIDFMKQDLQVQVGFAGEKIAVYQKELDDRKKAQMAANATAIVADLSGHPAQAQQWREKAMAMQAGILAAQEEMNKAATKLDEAQAAGKVRIALETNAMLRGVLEDRKKDQEEITNSNIELDRMEKAWSDNKVARAEADVQEEADQFHKLVEARRAALISMQVDEKTFASEVKRMVQDETEFRIHAAKQVREANEGEFKQMFDFLDSRGMLSMDNLKEMSDMLVASTNAMLAQQGGEAINNKEFTDQIGILEKINKEMDELNGQATKGKEGFSQFFHTFDLGAISSLDKSGKVSQIIGGLEDGKKGKHDDSGSNIGDYKDQAVQLMKGYLQHATAAGESVHNVTDTFNTALQGAVGFVNQFAQSLQRGTAAMSSALGGQSGPSTQDVAAKTVGKFSSWDTGDMRTNPAWTDPSMFSQFNIPPAPPSMTSLQQQSNQPIVQQVNNNQTSTDTKVYISGKLNGDDFLTNQAAAMAGRASSQYAQFNGGSLPTVPIIQQGPGSYTNTIQQPPGPGTPVGSTAPPAESQYSPLQSGGYYGVSSPGASAGDVTKASTTVGTP